MLKPGRHFLWWPWQKVEFIVDTSTEIPYTAPVLSSPTQENVPLKSIEFFLKFRIVNPLLFVRHIGASNYDVVLSSAVQDAIRRRSRQVQTSRAYDLRGSDVGDMQAYLNKQMQRYGVQITGANIPDVQLPDQYRQNLATRERIAKELVAYEKEWELIRKRRTDALLMEIERAKKERDEKLIAVKEALNKAREDVAQMLQERETDAEKIRLEIEAKGRAELKSAENEARALRRLGESYKDNQAVLRYELALRRLEVAEKLLQQAPRPIMVNSQSEDGSALTTLMLAHILPDVMSQNGKGNGSLKAAAAPVIRRIDQ
jgi:regulator of protease activity HflC (stomatin/prohibitin superfamily)